MKGKMDTNTTPAYIHFFGESLLWKYAGSFLIFSTIFFGILLSSSLLLLPRVTSLDLWGNILPGQDLHTQWRSLHKEVASLEHTRDTRLLSSQDALYISLRERKQAQGSLQAIVQRVEEMRAQITQGHNDVISIDRMVFDRVQEGTLRLEGKVQHVGPRSMTLLVTFVEALQQISSLSVIEQPRFTRIQDPTGEFFSPFSFVLSTVHSLE